MLSRSIVLCALLASFTLDSASASESDDAKQQITLKSGITMAYRTAGPESAQPLILLHGLGDTSRSWALLVPDLSKHNRIYMLDQRGHGATEAPVCCYALADLGYDVITFMDAMKIETAIIAGHSLGSFVAQYLATAYPARVRAMILLGSADTTIGVDAVNWLWEQAGTFERGVPSAFVDEWQSNPTPVDPAFLSRVKTETAAVPVHVWKSMARTLLTQDSRRFLGEYKSPSMILWGEKDPMFSSANQERLRQLLPHATFEAYPSIGHNLHWERPQDVAADIVAFIASAGNKR